MRMKWVVSSLMHWLLSSTYYYRSGSSALRIWGEGGRKQNAPAN